MAVARTLGEAGGRHRDIDARYPGEPGVLSPAQHPGTRGRLCAGPTGHGDLPGHRRGARCVDKDNTAAKAAVNSLWCVACSNAFAQAT